MRLIYLLRKEEAIVVLQEQGDDIERKIKDNRKRLVQFSQGSMISRPEDTGANATNGR